MFKMIVTKKINKNVASRISTGSQNGLEAVIDLIEGEIQKVVPVISGDLKRSIKSNINGRTGYITATEDYAAYPEFGTYRMSPSNDGEGYMRLAVQNVKNKIMATYNTAIRKSLRR